MAYDYIPKRLEDTCFRARVGDEYKTRKGQHQGID